MVTCNSASPGGRTRTRAALCAGRATCRPPGIPRPPRSRSSVVPSAPRARVTGIPRGNVRRTIPCVRAHRGPSSSANSRKSATRPACSRFWLNDSPVPGTLTSCQNSSRSSRTRSIVDLSPASLRAMPHDSHITWPRSRWMLSTVRCPLIAAILLDARLWPSPGLAEGRMVGRDLRQLARGQVLAHGVGNDEIPVGQSLHQGARAQAIGAVVGEIGLAQHEQAGNRAFAGCSRPTGRPSCNGWPGRSASGVW